MGRLSQLFRKSVNRLFQKIGPARQPRRASTTRLCLEVLEVRLVPAVAFNAPFGGGNVNLSNTGQLLLTVGATRTTLESNCASFNVNAAAGRFWTATSAP
jgi:hypothetical protein